MANGFPLKPYLNDVKLDTSSMHYVRDGDFAESDIGARKAGMPKEVGEGRTMTIDHVGKKGVI